MTDIVLHHYNESPYAEKVRCLLGYKQLDWRSVTVPMVAPKPDLTALTAGYRKVPVMQIGADVYCDTRLIAEVIEDLAPSPAPAHRPAALVTWSNTGSTRTSLGEWWAMPLAAWPTCCRTPCWPTVPPCVAPRWSAKPSRPPRRWLHSN